MNKKIRYLIFLLATISAFFLSLSCSTEKPQYVVVGQPELIIQIEGEGGFGFIAVEVDDKRFSSAVPMMNKGVITALIVENQLIGLIDGRIVDGFVSTKDYGKVRILGMPNPVDLWVTPEQKDSLMKLKQ